MGRGGRQKLSAYTDHSRSRVDLPLFILLVLKILTGELYVLSLSLTILFLTGSSCHSQNLRIVREFPPAFFV